MIRNDVSDVSTRSTPSRLAPHVQTNVDPQMPTQDLHSEQVVCCGIDRIHGFERHGSKLACQSGFFSFLILECGLEIMFDLYVYIRPHETVSANRR